MEIRDFVNLKKRELKDKIASLKTLPCLVIIQVNDDVASNVYIAGKLRDGETIGAKVILDKQSPNISEKELLSLIQKYNNDNNVHGLIVQMPLPKHINEEKIKLAINPKKDVDGFNPISKFIACTPKGILAYLKFQKIDIEGKNAVIIGRSNIVGKPMQKLLLNENANVTQLHSKTKKDDMAFYLSHADIIVVAVGHTHFLNHNFSLKPTAVVIDVGINRNEGKIKGDCEPNLPVRLQTPVPGGVGLLTRLALFINLLEAYYGI